MFKIYDVIVVGGGHAGCEAAAVAAKMGSKTLLISMDMTKFAQMSCNPAMGGIAKGQIVREIDALGGYSGIITDQTTIQFRMLNKSKGPAMWSPRAQVDRMRFSQSWRNVLENIENLDLWQDTVAKLIINKGRVEGVQTRIGATIMSKTVILTNGTFLNGLMHIGTKKIEGGRTGENASYEISEQLKEYGFTCGRLKTGTPARIDGRSIDFSGLLKQEEEGIKGKFSYLPDVKSTLKQRSCWITYTNREVHEILESGFDNSPLYNGTIKGVGPRYCPSIESKLITFKDKEKHQLFLEPEGEETNEYYLNGFSSSLPWDIQYRALRSVKGLENAILYRPGYAIEYDYFDPTQLNFTLETKKIKNLYFAGQINGTTGYEEAAAQGFMAGVNAHLSIHYDNKNFVLSREEAYIGVLIDDLVTKGIDEPYRMFTSRAEYRVLLRQDNADERLTEKSFNLGIADNQRMEILKKKRFLCNEVFEFVNKNTVKPQQINSLLSVKESSIISNPVKIKDILMRPQISMNDLKERLDFFNHFLEYLDNKDGMEEVLEAVEIEIKYAGYINREKIMAEKQRRLENLHIKDKILYNSVLSLSTEARQKLSLINPETIGQASRIPGVSPSDINVLLIMLGR